MLLESFLPSSGPLVKPCPVCEQEGKFAYLEEFIRKKRKLSKSFKKLRKRKEIKL